MDLPGPRHSKAELARRAHGSGGLQALGGTVAPVGPAEVGVRRVRWLLPLLGGAHGFLLEVLGGYGVDPPLPAGLYASGCDVEGFYLVALGE